MRCDSEECGTGFGGWQGSGDHGSGCGCGCCCGHGSAGMRRRFMTKKEIKEALEKYREELESELQGVKERLKDLDRK
jgi:hypothetical protein